MLKSLLRLGRTSHILSSLWLSYKLTPFFSLARYIKELEKFVGAGLIKSIGISNFNKRQVQRILDNATIRPASLQIELHAYLQQHELVDFCKANNIVVTAYSPLGSGGIGKLHKQNGKE